MASLPCLTVPLRYSRDGMTLLKAPDVEHFRIPDTVWGIDEYAFAECPHLREVDIPYTISFFDDGLGDKACLRHAPNELKLNYFNWPYPAGEAERRRLELEVAEGRPDEHGFVYSKDGKRLLRAASIRAYWIPEGVEMLERMAFVDCWIEELHVPYTCRNSGVQASNSAVECVIYWEKPYAEQDDIVDSLQATEGDLPYVDDYGVKYSGNGRRLLGAMNGFRERVYTVPDGVVTICNYAFCDPEGSLEMLIIPPSVRQIGEAVTGSNKVLVVRRATQPCTALFWETQ